MSTRNVPPSMSESNLLAVIRQIFPDLEVDMKDIKNPTPAFIGNFYALILTEFGADINELSQIQMKQMTIISHVDMYSQTIPQINMYQAVNYFYTRIGVNDFSLSDLVNPNPKRTLVQLSAIMTFLQHCDSACHEIQEPILKLKEQKRKKDELLSKIESLKRDINQQATDRGRRNEKIKEFQQIIEKEKPELDELFKEKEMLKQTVEDVKRLTVIDDQKEAEYGKINLELREKYDKLSEMVVKSPDKLKNEWSRLQNKKDEVLKSIKSLQEKIEEKKKLNGILVSESSAQTERIQKLHELLEMEKSIEEMNSRLDSLKKKHAELTEEIDELKLKKGDRFKTIKTLKGNLEEVKSRESKQNAENEEACEAVEKEYELWSKKCQEKRDRENELEQSINGTVEKKKLLEKEVANANDYATKRYEDLCSQEKEIMDRYNKVLETAKQRNEAFMDEDLKAKK